MFEIIEEMGLTLSEVIGAGLVFAGFAGAMTILSKYGFYFIEILAG